MAATYGDQITLPALTVGGDLSSYQYHFVKLASTAGEIVNLAATTDTVIGILQDAPDASGEAAMVAAIGVSLVVAGTSTITAGASLTPDSTGRAITGGATAYAKALEAAGATGDLIRCVLGV